MNQILELGQTVQTERTGLPCTVEQFLGSGGQGEVYRANLDGKAYALKWYFPTLATDKQRWCLETLISQGSPSERFLWPQELASAKDVRSGDFFRGVALPNCASQCVGHAAASTHDRRTSMQPCRRQLS